MQESDTRIPLQPVIYTVILLLALFLRLYHLGAAPLSDFEARTALQAHALLNGQAGVSGGQPLTLSAVTALFFLLGENNFAARLFSALMGSALVLIPWFWKRQIGEGTAMLLAAALALAPGLVALSRLSGGPMPAIALGLAALTALHARNDAWGGFFLGWFALGGSWALTGLLGFALALGLARGSGLALGELFSNGKTSSPAAARSFSLRTAGLWAGGTLVLGGSLFLRFPQILGGVGEMFNVLGSAFASPQSVPFVRILAAVMLYHLPIAVLALAGAVLVWKDDLPWGRVALLWALAALSVTALFHQPLDAGWVLVPLSALGAHALHIALYTFDRQDAFTWGYAALILVLGSMSWLVLAGMPADAASLADTWQQWSIVGGALVVIVLSGVLIIMGWRPAASLQGGALGLTLFLGLVMFSQTWGVAQIRSNAAAELWYPSPAPANLSQLTHTLADAAEFYSGRRDGLRVRVDVDSPALRWALRAFPPADHSLPLAVITTADAPPPNADARYLGQDFTLQSSPAWTGGLPPAAVRWFVFREAPLTTERVTLWLRGDLFPGGSMLMETANPAGASDEPLTP
ncbi:MAG: hypothetical protein Fur0018_13200 [Anaerolineales bacterium]